MRPKAIDLFAGPGGLSLGLEEAGFDILGAIEWDEAAGKTYRTNFDHPSLQNDITEFGPSEFREFLERTSKLECGEGVSLVAGGPPCPGFSNIGRSKIISLLRDGGLDKWAWGDKNADELRHTFIQDPRNQLFLEFVKYVEHFEPRWFIMENVPGMLSANPGNIKVTVCHWMTLYMKAFLE